VADCCQIYIDRDEFTEFTTLPGSHFDEIVSFDLDVIISFGFRDLLGRALHMAKHGLWSVDHVGKGPPGFREVLEGQSTTASILRILGDNSLGEKIIYHSYAMTDLRSMKVNRNNLFWKSCRFVCRKLQELHDGGPQAIQGTSIKSEVSLPFSKNQDVPGNGEMLSLLCSFGRRFLAAKTNRLFRWDQWVLGCRIGADIDPSSPNLSGLKKIIPPRDRFWADPYPIKRDGKFYIFLEELIYRQGRGHLAVMEMSSDGSYQVPVKILEAPYHLSNPYVFEFQGSFYMVPETSQNKTLELYRCVEFPYRWQLDRVLMENTKAVDANLVEHEGRWWMFVNLADEDISDNYDELFLFYADSPLGPWKQHPSNPVKSDVRSARPAGKLIHWNGDWYRPAQDCSRRYGYSIAIQKVVRWDFGNYEEVEVSKILPEWSRNLVGTHTLNHSEGLTMVDGLLRRSKIL